MRMISCLLKLASWLFSFWVIFYFYNSYTYREEDFEQGPGPKMNLDNLSQDSPILIDIVRKKFIHKPSRLSYNLENNERTFSDGEGQLTALASILYKIENGTFLEVGANDGEYLSNTLWLEKVRGWSGILIEGDPLTFRKMLRKRRKAWQVRACLSPYKYAIKLLFHRHPEHPSLNGLVEMDPDAVNRVRAKLGKRANVKMQCIPLYTILLALGRTKIDFVSLDIEGSEMAVLNTIPFEKVLFKIITIECDHLPDRGEELTAFMVENGFRFFKKAHVDQIYIHSSVWEELVGLGDHDSV